MNRRDPWFRRHRPVYLAGRSIVRLLPESIAMRWLSRRFKPVPKVYDGTRWYLRGCARIAAGGEPPPMDGRTVLEAGTGVYNPAAAPLMLSGVSRLLLLEPFVGPRLDHRRLRARHEALLEMAEADPSYPLPKRKRVSDLRSGGAGLPTGVELLDRPWEATGLPDAAVDYVLSVSVLEHLRDPEAVLAESARILRPGGWMINLVDMRDHFFRYPFEMLKYSPRAWEMLTTASGGSGFLNRWRLGDWLAALERHGFATEVMEHLVDDERLARDKPYFAPEFRERSDEDLRVVAACLISRSSAAPSSEPA
jgi:SAM-dependent methyltransferase